LQSAMTRAVDGVCGVTPAGCASGRGELKSARARAVEGVCCAMSSGVSAMSSTSSGAGLAASGEGSGASASRMVGVCWPTSPQGVVSGKGNSAS
jgi:hypothetical protein